MIRRMLVAVTMVTIFAGCAPSVQEPLPDAVSQLAGDDRIRGVVAEVAPGARMIVLAEAVDGVALVVLGEDGLVFDPAGEEVSLADLVAGQEFTAVGSLASSDALLATGVQVHGEGQPAPTRVDTPAADQPASPTDRPTAEASETPPAETPPAQPVGPAQLALEEPGFGQSIASPVEVSGSIGQVPPSRTVRARVFDSQGGLIGEAALAVSGDPGQAGTFRGHVTFDAPSLGGGTVEVADVSVEGVVGSSARVQVGFDGTPSIVLSGVVGSFYGDPPLIVLEEPVHGFGSVALADETSISYLNGGIADESHIVPGKAIWASGFGGESGTLVAHEVVLIQDGVVPPEPEQEQQVIEIESPEESQNVESPFEIKGTVTSTPFEGTLVARLQDGAGQLLAEHPFIVDGEMGEPASFAAWIEYEVPTEGTATLEIVEISAQDGSILARTEVVILLAPTPDVVIVAEAKSVFPSARVIDLGEAVDGYDLVALEDATVLLNADGEEFALVELEPGTQIEVVGRPGSPGTLIAAQIRVLP